MSAISDTDQKQIEELVAKLLEHYDSVRIFVTRQNGEKAETASFDTGGGNFYAQIGHVQEWLTIHNRFAQNHADRKDEGNE